MRSASLHLEPDFAELYLNPVTVPYLPSPNCISSAEIYNLLESNRVRADLRRRFRTRSQRIPVFIVPSARNAPGACPRVTLSHFPSRKSGESARKTRAVTE